MGSHRVRIVRREVPVTKLWGIPSEVGKMRGSNKENCLKLKENDDAWYEMREV